jgi:peptidyl-prolyl cis-trans isomerase SurA
LEAANTILGQLNQGADFRVAAQQISSAPTAATGGDMGWVSVDDLQDELAAAVVGMEGPGLTPPVEVSNGVYLLQVANRKEPSALTTKVNLKRLISVSGNDTVLKDAVATIKSCDDVQTVANSNSDLRSGDLDDINVDDLGPEGKSLVLETEVGQPTQIFAASGGLALMYVCSREDGAEALPSREDIKGSLKNRELGMISERELRNLRREATIIYR